MSWYNPFTRRQAACRAWRVGQPLPCRTVYMYYNRTMQANLMEVMGRKLVFAEALEGKFSTEGLATMGDDNDMTLALARALVDQVEAQADVVARSLGFARAPQPAPAVVPMPAARPSRPTLNLTPEELEVLKKMFGRVKHSAG